MNAAITKCAWCDAVLRPVNMGEVFEHSKSELVGGRMWLTVCCGIVERYIEKPAVWEAPYV